MMTVFLLGVLLGAAISLTLTALLAAWGTRGVE